MENNTDIQLKKAKEIFEEKEMKAALIQNDERFTIIDFRRVDGCSDFYCNFIVDKERGALMISGDLGGCIADWHNPNTTSNLAEYIKSVRYFIEKMESTSDKYTFREEDVLEDIKKHIKEYEYDLSKYENTWDTDDDPEENFYEDLSDELSNSLCSNSGFHPSDRLVDMIKEFDDDYWEWLYDCGKRISFKVYLWIAGFNIACEQLAAQLETELSNE